MKNESNLHIFCTNILLIKDFINEVSQQQLIEYERHLLSIPIILQTATILRLMSNDMCYSLYN